MGEFSADEGRCYLDASYDRFPKISLSYCPKEQRKAEKVIPSVQSGSVTPTLWQWQGKDPHFSRFSISLSVASIAVILVGLLRLSFSQLS